LPHVEVSDKTAKFGSILIASGIIGILGLGVGTIVNSLVAGVFPTPNIDFFIYLFASALVAGLLAPVARGIPSSLMFGISTVILGVTFFGLPLEAVGVITTLVLNSVIFFVIVKLISSGGKNIGAVR
jgi:hypothetical protein